MSIQDWRASHQLDAAVEEVETLLFHPPFVVALPEWSPMLSSVELTDLEDDGQIVRRVAVCQPAFQPPPVPGVTTEMFHWQETIIWDREAHRGSFNVRPNIPEHMQRGFSCRGLYTLSPMNSDRTQRQVSLQLRITAPVVGRMLTRFLMARLAEHFAGEAAYMMHWIEKRASDGC